jgi:hypothetical protein
MWTAGLARLALAACVAAAALGCGGGEGWPDAEPPAPDANALTCNSADGVGGQTFEMAIGIKEGETGFAELADDDQCPLVIGGQGLLMLLLDVRGTFAIPEDSVCLECSASVGPTDTFDGVTLDDGKIVFWRLDGTLYDGYLTFILGSRVELEPKLDGASAPVTLDCIGHGFSQRIERTLSLYVLQPQP